MSDRTHHDILRDDFDIDPTNLGCVMLPVTMVRPLDYAPIAHTLYVDQDPDHPWVQAIPANPQHITLLHGLTRPAWQVRSAINDVLNEWTPPEGPLTAHGIAAFGSSDAPWRAIVATVHHWALDEAHARLSKLPHVDPHASYRAHITLAYVKSETVQEVDDYLSNVPLTFRPTGGIAYGQGMENRK
jgi:2'-5' RNA ligase